MIPTGTKPNKELERRLKKAASKPMTKEEIRRQRISFVYGNMPSRIGITRDQVAELLDKHDGQ